MEFYPPDIVYLPKMTTYLFYDLETTGLNYAFDQLLQFAAIRTDAEFNELERHEITVKLRPDVIPSPGAMIAHCISISQTMAGICEFEAIQQIHRLLNTPNTISLGYNTLGFDDEFLRFAFYRNLLPPYTHQYANNCGRMDLLPMVTMYWLYKNEVLEWPRIDDKVSLKLEHLSEANDLTEGAAHDALSDVEACVALARLLRAEDEMWAYLAHYFRKETDVSRKEKLPKLDDALPDRHRFGLLIGTDYGSKQNYQVPVVFIGDSIPYTNQSIWLRLDLPSLRETTEDSIDETTWVIRKKYGQLGLIIPPLDRFITKIDEERWAVVEQNKQWLLEHREMLEKISSYYREFAYADLPDADADAVLYQVGFPSYQDEELCRRFHKSVGEERVQIIDLFESNLMRELAKRVVFRNYLDRAPNVFKTEYDRYMQKVKAPSEEQAIVDYRGRKRLTPEVCLNEVGRLRDEVKLSSRQKDTLSELETYIGNKFGDSAQLGLL